LPDASLILKKTGASLKTLKLTKKGFGSIFFTQGAPVA